LIAGCVISCKSAPKTVESVQPEPEESQTGVVEALEVQTGETDEIIETVETEDAAEQEDDSETLAALEKLRQDHAELGEILTLARSKRQEIMSGKLYETAQQRFDGADGALNRATEAYGSDIETFDKTTLEDGRLALSEFSAIIDEWWLAKTLSLRETSAGAQQEALKVKADAAAKENYSRAAELHNKAESAFRGKDYRTAAEFYGEATPLFLEAVNISAEKKARAELALKKADNKITESEKLVDDAVKLLDSVSGDGEI
jgi:hypothetical protein